MKKAKWIALVMAVLMVLTCFTGCSKKQEEAPDEADTQAVQQDKDEKDEAEESERTEEESENQAEKTEIDTPSNNFKVSKLRTVEADDFISVSEGGAYFTDNKSHKYNFISPDGSKVTKTDYIFCEPKGKYFRVYETRAENESDYDGINSSGLVDCNGKVIIPLEYADITVLNERYAKVITVNTTTIIEDSALIYTTHPIYKTPVYYGGEWQVFDMEKGSVVPGVSDTKSCDITAEGNFFTYETDDEQDVTCNAEGKEIDDSIDFFENGTYEFEDAVYDANGVKMFDLKEPYNDGLLYTDGYYIACKFAFFKDKYVLLDEKGETVSAEFDEFIHVYGNAIMCGEDLYNFEGDVIFEGCTRVTPDEMSGKYYCLEDDNNTNTFIDVDGNVVAQFAENDTLIVHSNKFAVAKKNNDEYTYYSFKDKDFVYESGTTIAPWLISASDGENNEAIYDTLSGKSLVSGYRAFYTIDCEDGVYVYANSVRFNDDYDLCYDYDVYLIEAA